MSFESLVPSQKAAEGYLCGIAQNNSLPWMYKRLTSVYEDGGPKVNVN